MEMEMEVSPHRRYESEPGPTMHGPKIWGSEPYSLEGL